MQGLFLPGTPLFPLFQDRICTGPRLFFRVSKILLGTVGLLFFSGCSLFHFAFTPRQREHFWLFLSSSLDRSVSLRLNHFPDVFFRIPSISWFFLQSKHSLTFGIWVIFLPPFSPTCISFLMVVQARFEFPVFLSFGTILAIFTCVLF